MAYLALKGGKPVRTEPMPAYPVFGPEEEEAACRVVRSQNLCSQFGRETEQFEDEFAAYLGVKHAIGVSSGTTALHVALAALGIGPGDEVIVPSYTFMATATSVLMQNAAPVFADAEERVLGIDIASARANITKRTRAIIPVHANGLPMEIGGLMALAREHNLSVIEDCSHAHGARYGGRMVGTFGQINVFSFQQKKNLSLGEGGIVVTSDDQLAAKSRALRSFGEGPMTYNYRMSEFHAAIGRVRLRCLDEQNDARRRNADYLHNALDVLDGIQTVKPLPESDPVYYNFIVRIDPGALRLTKGKFIEAVRAEGVTVGPGYAPVHRMSIFTERNPYGLGCPYECLFRNGAAAPDAPCPTVERLCDNQLIEIKIHPPAGPADMKDIADAFRKVVEHIDEL